MFKNAPQHRRTQTSVLGKVYFYLAIESANNVPDCKRKNIIAPLFHPTGTSKTKMLGETVVSTQRYMRVTLCKCDKIKINEESLVESSWYANNYCLQK